MRLHRTATTIVLLAALVLAGCGSSGTRTVSAPSSASAASTATTASSARTPATPRTTKTEPQQTATAQTTRTATAPAFTKETSGGEGAARAAATVRAHGYTPDDTSQYRHDQALRVLVATRTGSADGYAQQAFFFVDGSYIGTDTASPSAGIRLVSQGDTEATLAYRLYRPGDPLCCAHGGEADVRFQLDNGRLVPLDPIPPASSSTVASRR